MEQEIDNQATAALQRLLRDELSLQQRDHLPVSGDAEIAESYYELKKLNAVLESRIEHETRRLETQQQVLEELEEINRALKQAGISTVRPIVDDDKEQRNEHLLRDHLRYVCEQIGDANLQSLIETLLSKSLDANDPYIDATDSPTALDLLKRLYLVEPYNENFPNLVKLVWTPQLNKP